MRPLARKTVLTLALGAVAILVQATWAPREASGLTTEAFYKNKLSWNAEADLVLAGSSRVQLDLAPQAFSRALNGTRVLNFGFPAQGFSEDYLDGVERVLDPRGKRWVLLELTPSAMSDLFCEKGFYARRKRYLAYDNRWDGYERLIRQMSPCEFFWGLCSSHVYQRYTRDGWLSVTQVKEKPDEYEADIERDLKQGGAADPKIVAGLLSRVRRWTQAGIRVYGFRAPLSPRIREIEDSLGGVDAGQFAAELRVAGGTFIDIDNAAYHSYDGSHLGQSEALRLSAELAGHLIQGAPVPPTHP